MGHDLIDKRSLAYNRLIVQKIRQQPERMDFVRTNLDRALNDPELSNSCKDALREWDDLFHSCSVDKILNILVEESDEGQRLRHSTPFWGVLTPQERQGILRQFRQYEAPGA